MSKIKTIQEYIELSSRTEALPTKAMVDRLNNYTTIRLLHAGMGFITEAGEFIDGLKKHIFYGKPLDMVNLEEEVGDLMWYIALFLNAVGVDSIKMLQRNVDKLRARFPEKFTEANALTRDLGKEREILEGK